uniref:EF-hand domain-containing protein n=1 Tax=Ditylenchus dipsaci TaxID=166011 RepID=A0A915ESV0_9BILA
MKCKDMRNKIFSEIAPCLSSLSEFCILAIGMRYYDKDCDDEIDLVECLKSTPNVHCDPKCHILEIAVIPPLSGG